jgi:hypothetical protein
MNFNITLLDKNDPQSEGNTTATETLLNFYTNGF